MGDTVDCGIGGGFDQGVHRSTLQTDLTRQVLYHFDMVYDGFKSHLVDNLLLRQLLYRHDSMSWSDRLRATVACPGVVTYWHRPQPKSCSRLTPMFYAFTISDAITDGESNPCFSASLQRCS